jgi:hypothetical protein
VPDVAEMRRDSLNGPDGVPVELVELLGGHPQLLVLAAVDDAPLEARDVIILHIELDHVPDEGVALSVPVAG